MFDPLGDKEVIFDNFKGKWVLLNLWATWCPPCQAEMPSLEILEKNFGDKLTIIALSADDSIEPVLSYIQTHKPSFKVYFDQKKQMTKLLGIDKYPETFLISPEGRFVSQMSGPRDWSSKAAFSYFEHIIK
ncbi:MAG: TlpA family protein disulfide reductase [Myxococcales bacterium]|nr:MAG: TlpA family protein disulfide reductase [Myxococcales bacterium]